MIRANSPEAFTLSVLVHAVVAGAIVWASFNFNRAPVVTPIDITVVDIDDIPLGETTQMPGPPNGPMALGVPNLKFKKPKFSKPATPPPEPAPEQNSAKPGKNTPASKPPPRNSASYAEWQKQNAKQLAENAKANNSRSNGKTPRINSKQYEEAMAGAASGNNASKATLAALDKYFAQLNRALQMAFVLPPGVSELLEAQVQFYLAADGSLSAVRIIKTSGDAEFDKAVLEAFRKVRSIGPLPGGKGATYSLTFAMNDAG